MELISWPYLVAWTWIFVIHQIQQVSLREECYPLGYFMTADSSSTRTQLASFGYSSGDKFQTDLLRRASPSSQCVGTEAFSALMTVSSSFVTPISDPIWLISDPIWLVNDAIWLFSDVVCCARSFVCGFFAGPSTLLLANTSRKALVLATFPKFPKSKLAGCLTGSSAATDYVSGRSSSS